MSIAAIDRKQAEKIIAHLLAEGFLANSALRGGFTSYAAPKGPVCTLEAHSWNKAIYFYEDLGWGPKMVSRLDGLRKVLDGDAAKAMDVLLGRFEGHRSLW